jgi:hypothetical protein
MKARQAVRNSRLELDAAKQRCVPSSPDLSSPRIYPNLIPPHTLASNPSLSQKTASPARQEQARLEVENAEDDLVQKTEVAITLMKTVLDNVRSYSYFLRVLFPCAWAMWLSTYLLPPRQ